MFKQAWKVGYQTIIWGKSIHPGYFDSVLEIIAGAGFQGVEIAQHPETVPRYPELREKLKAKDLKLLGLAGGTLEERIDYLGGRTGDESPYLCIANWEENPALQAIADGFHLALQPQVFMEVYNLEGARVLLNRHKDLWWLPDTAHLAMAGENVGQAIREFRERMVAIHLKDWTSRFGRSSHRYSRGFTKLGDGDLRLDEILMDMDEESWPPRNDVGLPQLPWLIVEQDSSPDPAADVYEAARWLSDHGVSMPLPKPMSLQNEHRLYSAPAIRQDAPGRLPVGRRFEFLKKLDQVVTAGPRLFYQSVVREFAAVVECRKLWLWAVSLRSGVMTLLADYPEGEGSCTLRARGDDSDVWRAVLRQAPHVTDLRDRQDLAASAEGPYQVEIPVFNSFNPQHVRFLVQFVSSECPSQCNLADYAELCSDLARVADSWMNDQCLTAASRASGVAEGKSDSQKFLDALVTLIKDVLECQGCTIFLVDPTEQRLEPKASTTIAWRDGIAVKDQFYILGEGNTGGAWRSRGPVLIADGARQKGHQGKSREVVNSVLDSYLLDPILDHSGKVLGVVRCRNKSIKGDSSPRPFSDDDLAVLDAMLEVAVPHLVRLLESEQRMKTLMRVTHELKRPLTGIRGALDCIQRDLGPPERMLQLLREDYVTDALSWTELMSRLLSASSVLKAPTFQPRRITTKTLLMAEIVAPAVRQVGAVLKERGFSPRRVEYSGFKEIPALYVDKNRFEEVFFNLLDNAIKYAHDDPSQFHVEIVGSKEGMDFLIECRDWGSGIPPGWEELIFQEGLRGPTAVGQDVQGQGLGLWIVRQVIEAHSGSVRVTRNAQPTQFTIRLPGYLANRPPIEKLPGGWRGTE